MVRDITPEDLDRGIDLDEPTFIRRKGAGAVQEGAGAALAGSAALPGAPSLPAVPGYEVAGTVDAVGQGVAQDRERRDLGLVGSAQGQPG